MLAKFISFANCAHVVLMLCYSVSYVVMLCLFSFRVGSFLFVSLDFVLRFSFSPFRFIASPFAKTGTGSKHKSERQ